MAVSPSRITPLGFHSVEWFNGGNAAATVLQAAMKALPAFCHMPISSSTAIIESCDILGHFIESCDILRHFIESCPIQANQIRADVYAGVTLVLASRAKLYCGDHVVDLRLPELMVETAGTILAEALHAIKSEASVVHARTIIDNAQTAFDIPGQLRR